MGFFGKKKPKEVMPPAELEYELKKRILACVQNPKSAAYGKYQVIEEVPGLLADMKAGTAKKNTPEALLAYVQKTYGKVDPKWAPPQGIEDYLRNTDNIRAGALKNEVATQELMRLFLHYILDPSHKFHQNFATLDWAVPKLIAEMNKPVDPDSKEPARNTPEALCNSVQTKQGKVDPAWQPPDALGKMSQDEALQELLKLNQEYGKSQTEDYLRGVLKRSRYSNGKPYEYFVQTVRETFERAKQEAEAAQQQQREEEERQALQKQQQQQQQHLQASSPAPTEGGGDPPMRQTSLVPVSEPAESAASPYKESPAHFPTEPSEQASVGYGSPHGRRSSVAGRAYPKIVSPRFGDAPLSPSAHGASGSGSGLQVPSRRRTPSIVSSGQGEEGPMDPMRAKLAASVAKGSKKVGRRMSLTTIQQQYEDRQRQQQDDYASLYDEVARLKKTIEEQVSTHKNLIGLHQDQQDFLNKYLLTCERENGAMAAEAHMLRIQYRAALDQWHASQTIGQGIGAGSPIHLPSRSPARTRGVVTWLDSLGLGDYAELFAFNEIDFNSLTLLSEEDLVRMGVQALGPRKTLMRGIADLARQQVEESPRAKSRARVAQAIGHTHAYRQASDSPLHSQPLAVSPPEWRAHVDTTTSRVYYHNAATGESKWELPEPCSGPLDLLTDLL